MADNFTLDSSFGRFVRGEIDEGQLEVMLTGYLGSFCGISPFCPAGDEEQAQYLGRFCLMLLRAAANCRQGIRPDRVTN